MASEEEEGDTQSEFQKSRKENEIERKKQISFQALSIEDHGESGRDKRFLGKEIQYQNQITEKNQLTVTKSLSVVACIQGQGGSLTAKRHKGTFRSEENILCFVVVVLHGWLQFSKLTQPGKWVYFIVCKLYSNKAGL